MSATHNHERQWNCQLLYMFLSDEKCSRAYNLNLFVITTTLWRHYYFRMSSGWLQDDFPIFIHLSDKILSRALNLHLRASGSVQVSCLSEVRLRSLSSLTLGPVHIYRPTDLDLQGPTIKVSSQSELGCNFCQSPQLSQLQPESNK